MRSRKPHIFRLLLLCVVLFGACKKEPYSQDHITGKQTILSNDTLPPVIAEDVLLTNTHVWYIKDWVYVSNEAVLSIEPGTVVKMSGGAGAGLVITRGARIIAAGLPDLLIHFQLKDSTANNWSGIIILGKAPQRHPFEAFEHSRLPISSGLAYGGNLPDDSSGVLQNVKIDYTSSKEKTFPPGLLLLGAGSRTRVNDIRLCPINKEHSRLNNHSLP